MPFVLIEREDKTLEVIHSDELPDEDIPILFSFVITETNPDKRVYIWDADESRARLEEKLAQKQKEREEGIDEVLKFYDSGS